VCVIIYPPDSGVRNLQVVLIMSDSRENLTSAIAGKSLKTKLIINLW